MMERKNISSIKKIIKIYIYYSINSFEILNNYKILLICIDNQGQRIIRHILLIQYYFSVKPLLFHVFCKYIKVKKPKTNYVFIYSIHIINKNY